jgi:hypothetical protein
MRNYKAMMIMMLAVFFLTQAGQADAFGQKFGFHLGSCAYENDLGDIYDEDSAVVGLNYDVDLIQFFGINMQYDYIFVSTGRVNVYDSQNHYLDSVGTDLRGGVFSITPTFYFRFIPMQIIVPHVGLGLSYFYGVQEFHDSPYLRESDNNFGGSGVNLTAGIDIQFVPRFGFQIESRVHFINLDVEEGSNNSNEETNKISEYYVGFFWKM